MTHCLRSIVAGVFAIASAALHAHVTGTGLATLDWQGDRATLLLTLAPSEVSPSAGASVAAAAQGDEGASRRVGDWLQQHVRLSVGDAPCRVTRTRLQATAGGDRLVMQQDFQCAAAPGRLDLSDTLSTVFGEHYRTITSVGRPDGTRVEQVFDPDHTRAAFDFGRSAPSGFGGFLRLGATHISGGWDHLLFLAALLIGQHRLRALLITVTAFTLAHSMSLAAATLGWLHVSAVWVEPVIALSIVWVALENLIGQAAAWRRNALTVLFGFVHGLAFAEGPAGQLKLGFNLGVELAQAVVVVAVAPLLAWLARRPRGASIERALSLGIAAMGAIWLVQRLAGI